MNTKVILSILLLACVTLYANSKIPQKPSATHYSVRLFTPDRALHSFVNREKQWYSAIYEDGVFDILVKIYYFDKPETAQKNSSTFIVLADGVGCFKTSALNFTVLDILWTMDFFTSQYKGIQKAPESGFFCDTFTDEVQLLHYYVTNSTSNSTEAVNNANGNASETTIPSESAIEEMFMLQKQNNGQVDLKPLVKQVLKYSLAQLQTRSKQSKDNDRVPVEAMFPVISEMYKSSNGKAPIEEDHLSALFEDYKTGERMLPVHAFEVPVPEDNCIELSDFQLRTMRSLLLYNSALQ